YDETSYARLVAKRFNTDHTEFIVEPGAFDLIDKLVWHHDGPFGDSSAVPTYIVSKLTREQVTVVLTGDGGDELFAGYLRFAAAVMSDRIPAAAGRAARAVLSPLPTPANDRHWFARAQRFARAAADPLDVRLTKWNALFYDDLEQLLSPDFAARVPVGDKLRYLAAEAERRRGLST